MFKSGFLSGGGYSYDSPESREFYLSPAGPLCLSENAEAINSLTAGETDDFSDYEPW